MERVARKHGVHVETPNIDTKQQKKPGGWSSDPIEL